MEFCHQLNSGEGMCEEGPDCYPGSQVCLCGIKCESFITKLLRSQVNYHSRMFPSTQGRPFGFHLLQDPPSFNCTTLGPRFNHLNPLEKTWFRSSISRPEKESVTDVTLLTFVSFLSISFCIDMCMFSFYPSKDIVSRAGMLPPFLYEWAVTEEQWLAIDMGLIKVLYSRNRIFNLSLMFPLLMPYWLW